MAEARTYLIAYLYMKSEAALWYRHYWVLVPAERWKQPRFRQVGFNGPDDKAEWDISRAEAAEILVDARQDDSVRRI